MCASVFSLELDIVWDPKDIEDVVFVPKVYNQAVKILTQVPPITRETSIEISPPVSTP